MDGWRRWGAAGGLLIATGCSSSAPAPAPAANKPTAAPQAVVIGAKPAPKPTEKAAPAKKTDKPATKPSFAAGEEPGNVFAFVGDGETVEVSSEPPPVPPEDRFVVTAASPADDSTRFRVTAVGAGLPKPSAEPVKPPAGFAAVPEYGWSDDGHPLRIRCEKDGSLMAFVPGSGGALGSNDGPSNARPAVPTLLDPFYCDVFEVTLGEFRHFREEQRANKRPAPLPSNDGAADDVPALGLSWAAASAYLKSLGKDLPTEAEWEKAARGPEGWRYPWGNGRPIWSSPRNFDTVGPVAAHRTDQSPYGVYDLAGNAKEWLADWYSDQGHADAKAGRLPLKHSTGAKKPSAPNLRVVKGAAGDWAAWTRTGREMQKGYPDVGFRGVLRLSAKPSGAAADSEKGAGGRDGDKSAPRKSPTPARKNP